MKHPQSTSPDPIVVTGRDGVTIEVAPTDDGVHLALDRPEATLDQRAADDLVHAVLEALS
jgi:hypothetical protein